MPDDNGLALVQKFFPGTANTYDRIVKLCTFGFDSLWKQRILEKIPGASAAIIDQACGTGILTMEIARKFPHAFVAGVDVTGEYIRCAKEKAERLNLTNVHFILGRAEDVLLHSEFDCIVSSYLAKYAHIATLVSNTGRMLKSGGVLVMHDFTYPRNRPFRMLWELYFKLLQSAGARRHPEWRNSFDGLPALLRETRWTDDLERCLCENGFAARSLEYLTFGTAAIITAVKV